MTIDGVSGITLGQPLALLLSRGVDCAVVSLEESSFLLAAAAAAADADVEAAVLAALLAAGSALSSSLSEMVIISGAFLAAAAADGCLLDWEWAKGGVSCMVMAPLAEPRPL